MKTLCNSTILKTVFHCNNDSFNMAKMAVWLAVLLTLGALTETAKSLFYLDMALDSVDDAYAGCEGDMERKVRTDFLPSEKNQNSNFSLAWNEAEKHYNKKWRPKHGKLASRTLAKEEIMAVYVYTTDKPEVYPEFNEAVRSQKMKYKTAFRYHTLHFFLTRALKRLSARRSVLERCLTGYRRVDGDFSQDVLNEQIRFGSFTSSSLLGYQGPYRFGDKTCFEISTCLGADVSLYSKFGESEAEVLIPPYEVFKVTQIKSRSEQKSLACDVVLKLKSTQKALSNLNCAAL
ncbi:PREDICTED: ecto-ADP-ribosyltransferase 5-like isoform X2 [Poecilia mexicana]|uniref:NAD(P)(+)--arginine ADP-ribosyltransferase n=1 Tax=Poecilia mexicana TaxID=48701 RepID=A0A3B3YUB4_9TELE|nr:PREDICTED: ecto-ADP-ribosyltransferase 5-like isoform X2 [Poecilia mexicana]